MLLIEGIPLAYLLITLTPFFLCWGSFLNVVALRALNNRSLFARSACPACNTQLVWWQLIPLVSWIVLAGRCAFCKTLIPSTYPLMELATALIFGALFVFVPIEYLPAYAVFFSAMIINIHTDSRELLLLTLCTAWLVPVGLLAACFGLLPLSFLESIVGALLGGGLLWLTRWIFWKLRGVEGMGWGDIELLAGVGSFVGPFGVLMTLLIGSLAGSLYGITMLATGTSGHQLKLPFGAFLAAAAMVYCLWSQQLLNLFL